ncbi:MAG TPA: TIGR04283 family arsenosugar biosynthesis glycosyltransferase [Gaiellaceae bacterium]|nr:TIGR04283 family arsenosugar biosynthesis glycosyltransferase [Gaiellaceae bacterium]
MTAQDQISVIVPVLDEALAITGLLDHLADLPGSWDVLVVDAGSRDDTVTLAARHPSRPRVIQAGRGRALQMNAGAEAARSGVLLFLHADTRLPQGAHDSITSALADPEVLGGNFALHFDGGDRFSRILGTWYSLQRRAGVYYGDSAIWIREPAFRELGGFLPLPIMEDYDLVRRLERAGRTRCLAGPAITSARRWKQFGLIRTVASWVAIRWLYLAGVSPARLARLYPHARG